MSNGIIARRQALGWTQKDLAQRAHVAQSLVSDAENGRRANPRKVQIILDTLAAAERESSGIPDETTGNPDSSGLTEPLSSNTETMNPRQHSTVQPVATSTARLPPDVERVIGEVFDAQKHRLSDANAIAKIAAKMPSDERTAEQMRAVLRAMLDAASRLRLRGVEVTPEALLVESLSQR